MGLFDWLKQPSFGRGWLPDEADARDVRLRDVATALHMVSAPPPSVNLRHPAISPRDQDGVQACVGFAWAQGLELAYADRGLLTGDLSAQWIWFLGRATRGTAGLDRGMQLRDAAKIITRLGCATEETCPFVPRKFNVSPTWTAYRNAYDRRGLRGYYRIDEGDADGVRVALAAGRPVVGGWMIDQAFVDFRGRSVLGPSINSLALGGHALCVLGYDRESFTIINSWGPNWGDDGYARVTPSFIQQGSDLWAIDVHAS